LPAPYDSIQLYTAVPHPNTKRFVRWCVTKYRKVNLDIIYRSSQTTDCPLYVVHASREVSCFVTWRRKQIFLYGTKCL